MLPNSLLLSFSLVHLVFRYLWIIHLNTELLLVGCCTLRCMVVIVDFGFHFCRLLQFSFSLSWRCNNHTFCHDSVSFRPKPGWILDSLFTFLNFQVEPELGLNSYIYSFSLFQCVRCWVLELYKIVKTHIQTLQLNEIR